MTPAIERCALGLGVGLGLGAGPVGVGIGVLVAIAALVTIAALLLGAVAASSRLAPPAVGAGGSIVGAVGTVKEAHGNSGQILAEGARWQAVATAPLEVGMRVEVVAVDGLVVTVRPVA